MNLNISGHHLELTPALREYLVEKLERVRRHFDQVIDVDVFLSVEKLRQRAEISLHMRGKKVFVEAIHENLYAAIDLLVDKLDRQVCKHKEKVQDHAHESMKYSVPAA